MYSLASMLQNTSESWEGRGGEGRGGERRKGDLYKVVEVHV